MIKSLATSLWVAAAMVALPSTGYGSTVIWNSQLPNYARFDNDGASQNKCIPVLLQPNVTITYGADAVDKEGISVCGRTVPVGSTVTFSFHNLSSSNIFWFGSGYYFDSPYGDSVPLAAAPSRICLTKNLFAANYQVTAASWADLYGTISVNPPSRAVADIGPNFLCGKPNSVGDVICKAIAPGSIKASFNFTETYARPFFAMQYVGQCSETAWGSSKPGWPEVNTYTSAVNPYDGTGSHICSGKGDSQFSVPAQSISCPLTVVPAEGKSPTAPVVNALEGVCTIGKTYTLSMSATDPDGSELHYSVDWDNDGFTDQMLPSVGSVPSGTLETASRTFAVEGNKTVTVRAVDANGLSSLPVYMKFACTKPDTSAVEIMDDGSYADIDSYISGLGRTNAVVDVSLRVLPSLVRRNQTTNVVWDAQGVTRCTVVGSNGDSWSGLQSPVKGELTTPIIAETIYTLSCVGPDGEHIKSTKVKIVPEMREI